MELLYNTTLLLLLTVILNNIFTVLLSPVLLK